MSRTALGPACAARVLTAAFLASSIARAQLVINEFLPDPAGSDAGHEFVELLNVGPGPVDLGGWRLEFANGAEAADWQLRWSGVAGQALAAGDRFLIADRNWAGTAPADAEVYLALQNGPDALRLTQDGLARDVVGYGALTDTLLMEGRPAPVAPGRSLARRPDGRDTGDNRADFVTAEPTPGAANFAARALVALETVVEPPSLARAGNAAAVAVLLRNEGTEPLPAARLRLACGPDTVGAMLDAVDSGGERRVEWVLRPRAEGGWPLRLLLGLAAPPETLVVDLGRLQVGAAELVLSEVLGAPRAGQGEWIEILAGGRPRGGAGSYRIRDDDGGWVALPDLRMAPGDRLVVVQDSLALQGWLAANRQGPQDAQGCGAALVQLSPWPSLNNSPPEGRLRADRLQLADSLGTVIDHADLGADGRSLAGDRSLERARAAGATGSAWAECLAPAGSTPGCANSVDPPPGLGDGGSGGLLVEPPVADRGAGQSAVHLRFEVPAGAAGWDISVCDLDGRRVRDLGGDGDGPGPRALFWDLRDDRSRPVGAGGYVVSLRFRAGTAAAGAVRRLVVVR